MESSDSSKLEQKMQKFPDRNQWPMARVIGGNADDLGFVQSVRLLLGSSCDSAGERVLERPMHKIVLIKEVEV